MVVASNKQDFAYNVLGFLFYSLEQPCFSDLYSSAFDNGFEDQPFSTFPENTPQNTVPNTVLRLIMALKIQICLAFSLKSLQFFPPFNDSNLHVQPSRLQKLMY